MNTRKIYNQFRAILKSEKPDSERVMKCLLFLKDDYKEILEKSFFNINYEYWWVDYYSVTNYYRKRLRAIRSFVCLFKTINEDY